MNPDPNQQNEIVEFTTDGRFVDEFTFEPNAAGAAFGIAMYTDNHGHLRFAAVDDATNFLDVWSFNRFSADHALAMALASSQHHDSPVDQSVLDSVFAG